MERGWGGFVVVSLSCLLDLHVVNIYLPNLPLDQDGVRLTGRISYL